MIRSTTTRLAAVTAGLLVVAACGGGGGSSAGGCPLTEAEVATAVNAAIDSADRTPRDGFLRCTFDGETTWGLNDDDPRHPMRASVGVYDSATVGQAAFEKMDEDGGSLEDGLGDELVIWVDEGIMRLGDRYYYARFWSDTMRSDSAGVRDLFGAIIDKHG